MAIVEDGDFLQQITEIMVNFREKKKIFPPCCRLLSILCQDASVTKVGFFRIHQCLILYYNCYALTRKQPKTRVKYSLAAMLALSERVIPQNFYGLFEEQAMKHESVFA